MLQLPWIAAGVILGLLISTVLIPPTRKEKALPTPYDDGIFHTDVGCVRFGAIEVPCTAEPDSLNLLQSKQ
jgi:hypothetical protein